MNMIAQSWNKTAKKKGWSARTKNALKIKATRLLTPKNGSLKSLDNNWDSSTLSRLLGTPLDKVRSWRRRGIIEFTKLSRNQTAISRTQLREFALTHPEELGGIDPKKLRRVLKDGHLVNAVLKVANNAPTMGRSITVIRLDTGDVYPSAKNAACAIAPVIGSKETALKSRILLTCNRDTPMTNGMDFFRLDYPVYWCPLDIRPRFNSIAGKILYQIYLELRNLGGYSKRSCLTVAARLAVQITLMSFRKQESQRHLGEEISEIEIIAQYWQDVFLRKIKQVIQYDYNLVFRKIQYSIKNRVYRYFIAIAHGDRSLAEGWIEDFTLFYIEKQRARFMKGFLPKNYLPSDRLQNADLLAFIYGSLLVRVDLNEHLTGISIVSLISYHFVRKYRLNELQTTRYLPEYKEHQESSTTNDSAIELELILDKLKKITAPDKYEQISLYVALKLEDASDEEIVETMKIGHQKLSRLQNDFYCLARQTSR